jgi:hypothetical protein
MVASHSRGTSRDSRRFISGLVIGIIALVIVKDLKDIWQEKQYH